MSNPRLQVDIGASTKELDGALNSIDAKMKQLGQSLMTAGAAFTKAFTVPIVGGAGFAIKAFDTQIKAEARLRTALEANGRQVNDLFKDYKEFASGLQQITTVGDETTLEMLQVAEAMGLTGESAKRAVKNAIAMGKAFGVNEKSAIRYTASLEQGDATMLTRYIPALRSVTDEAEKTALAHDILSKAFGAATAEAQVGLGPVVQLKNNFGDLMEQIGELISNAITPFVEKLNSVVLRFKDLDQPTKAFYTGIALITAAIGPVLLLLGTLIRVLTTLRLRVLGITVVIIAMVGGFVYVVKNLEAFEIVFQNTWARITNFAITGSQAVIDALAFISQGLTAFGVSGYALQGTFEALSSRLNAMRQETINSKVEFQTFQQFVNALKLDFADLFGVLDEGTDESLPVFNETLKSIENNILSIEGVAKSFTGSFSDGLASIITEGGRLDDMLKRIGKQLLKSGLAKLFEALLLGGLPGAKAGFLGTGGGLLGSIFPQIFGTGTAPISMGAATPQLSGANVTVGGQFVLKGTDLVGSIIRTNKSILR